MDLALRELLILSMAKTFWFQESSSFSRVALALSGSSQTCVFMVVILIDNFRCLRSSFNLNPNYLTDNYCPEAIHIG